MYSNRWIVFGTEIDRRHWPAEVRANIRVMTDEAFEAAQIEYGNTPPEGWKRPHKEVADDEEYWGEPND